MFFFHLPDGEVVVREHEFNSEAIDGSITLLNAGAECSLLMHTPTAQFNYVVTEKKGGLVSELWELLTKVNNKPTIPPSIYYTVVLRSMLDDYLQNPNFKFVVTAYDPTLMKNEIKVATIKPRIFLPDRDTTEETGNVPTVEVSVANLTNNNPGPDLMPEPSFKLRRDKEEPVYSYKSPSKI